MTVLLQVSDPHFGTERPMVVDALVRLVADEAPELVVLSGDITQRATAAQFTAARRFVDRLATSRSLVIPGNHDIPLFDLFSRAFRPYARYRTAFGPDLEPEHRSPSWLVIGVRTTRRWRHENGEVSDAQIERVAARLEAATPAQMRVVVVHQPVVVQSDVDTHAVLRRHEAAVRRWTAAGMDAILGGHIHVPYVVPLRERYAGLPRAAWCVQAGTAVSSRVRQEAGNSVNLLRHDGGSGSRATRCVVERWDHDASVGRFVRVATDELSLARASTD